MDRSTLLHLRDWLGLAAAFGTVLFLTFAPHENGIPRGPHIQADADREPALYATKN